MEVTDKTIYEYYLNLGKEGGGDEYLVNSKTRYAFLLGEEDLVLFPNLTIEVENKRYLLVGEDDEFCEIAETYEDAEDEDDDDYDDELTPCEKAIKTLRLLRKSSSEESIKNLIKAVNEAAGYNITFEDLDSDD